MAVWSEGRSYFQGEIVILDWIWGPPHHITACSQNLGKYECNNQTSGTREPLPEISVPTHSYPASFGTVCMWIRMSFVNVDTNVFGNEERPLARGVL